MYTNRQGARIVHTCIGDKSEEMFPRGTGHVHGARASRGHDNNIITRIYYYNNDTITRYDVVCSIRGIRYTDTMRNTRCECE